MCISVAFFFFFSQGLFSTVQKMDSKWLSLVMKVLDEVKGETNWDGLFVRHKVHDLLWGYEDPILAKLHEGHNLIHFIPDEDPNFGFGVRNSKRAWFLLGFWGGMVF